MLLAGERATSDSRLASASSSSLLPEDDEVDGLAAAMDVVDPESLVLLLIRLSGSKLLN